MNKLLLVAAAGLSVAALSSPASAADGTINITGTVQSASCTVAAGSSSIAVALPPVSASALSAANSVAGLKAFQIALTGCTAGVPATAYFEAGPNIDPSGRLKNNGAATNVQVQLLNAGSTAINLAGASGAQSGTTITLVNGNNTLNYFAQYYSLGGATAGSVTTSVTYTMQYQ